MHRLTMWNYAIVIVAALVAAVVQILSRAGVIVWP